MESKTYYIPNPIVDKREAKTMEGLAAKYRDLMTDNGIKKMADSVGASVMGAAANAASLLPDPIQDIGSDIGEGIVEGAGNVSDAITSNAIFQEGMNRISDGIRLAQAHGHRFTVDPQKIIERAQKTDRRNDITSLNELCLLRSYELKKGSSMIRTTNLALALAEGGATGFFGLKGIPVSLVASTFLCLCVVESIATRYGFDVKNNDAELMIAATVFANGLNLKNGTMDNKLSRQVAEVMAYEVGTLVPDDKEYASAVDACGIRNPIKLVEELSREEAIRALEKAGSKNLEESVFRAVFEQLGKNLTITTFGKAMPVASIFVGAALDVTAVNQVINYADIFYQKRFIAEKADNIFWLTAGHPTY